MGSPILTKSFKRKSFFVFVLLTACPALALISGPGNMGDLMFLAMMFLPGTITAIVYLIVSFIFGMFLRKPAGTYLGLDAATFTILLFFLLIVFFNFNFNLGRHNDEIKIDIRNEIHALNNKLIKSIRNNEPSVMYDLFIEEVKKQGPESIENLYSQFIPLIEAKEFKLYNEYYMVSHNRHPAIFTAFSDSVADSEFYMHVNAPTNNTYISLLQSSGDFKDLLFSFIYVKVNDQWRLHTAHLGVFKIGGKTVLDWFQEADKLSTKGFQVPALLRLSIVNQLSRPAPFIQYAKEKEINSLHHKILAQFNRDYKFPICLTDIKDGPEIYTIEPQFVQTNLLPMIKYLTKIPLDNVDALQKEAEAITEKLEAIFPGLTENVSHVVYRAFSEPPTDADKIYNSYGLTVPVN